MSPNEAPRNLSLEEMDKQSLLHPYTSIVDHQKAGSIIVAGNLVFIAGQITFWNGEVRDIGKVGAEFSLEDGKEAARLCALNLLAQLREACGGDLDRIERCVKLGVFVNCVSDFDRQPEVANGASDLIVEVLGEKGRHARFAIGAGSLPRNVAVEADGIFKIR